MRKFFVGLVLATLVSLSLQTHAAIVISEFLTQNDGGLTDMDGETPDWIELHNTFTATNLAGWHLTDNPTNLTKWTFPATNISGGGYLVVFASGKNRATNGVELHTNFQLDSNGGYLALVNASGTVVSEYIYPKQRANVSVGIGNANTGWSPVMPSNTVARWLVPTNNSLFLQWTTTNFNDSTWSNSTPPLRYDVTLGGAAGAPILGIDFNDRDNDNAGNTQAGFNSFVIGSAGGTAAIQSGAITRNYGPYSVTLSNSSSSFGYDDRLRSTPVNNGPYTSQALHRDFVFSRDNSGTSGLDVAIAGLAANQLYEITVWSFDSGSPGTRVSDWYANGALMLNNYTFNGSVLPFDDSQNRFSFRAPANASGVLLVSARRDTASTDGSAPNFGVFLNALQLAPVVSAAVTNGNVTAMIGQNASLYVRQAFTVTDPSSINQLILRVNYNDGFIAYLNGTEVARRRSLGDDWNTTATGTNSAAVAEDVFLPGPWSLFPGTNVLAIHAVNVNATNVDFYIQAELLGTLGSVVSNRYFSPPIPGFANGPGFAGLVEDTKFSVNRGFYDTPFSLSITCATPVATIYYTTNGSAPSPSNGVPFVTPINITGNSFIRAAAFAPGLVPSDVDTHSYIFLRDVLRQSNNIPGYPTVWQASYPADYEMDSNIVNHPVYGATISNDLRSIPTLSIVSDQNGLWNSSTGIYPNPTSIGAAWERAASLELIRGDGHTEFGVTAKIQIHGNASRDNVRTPKHSIGVSFNSDYGPTKLRYDWFHGAGPKEHDGIVLRSCGFVDGWAGRYADNSTYVSAETGETFRGLRYRPENTCYLRDVWVKDSFRDMGWPSSRSQYVHLYINGLYWGLYEPSEHVNASYFSHVYSGPEGAWDVIVGEDNNGPPVIVDGSGVDWTNVLNLVNAGINTEPQYQAVAQLVDIDNLIDYMMLHIFAESEDWPRHNWFVAHRRATNGLPATKFTCTVWDQELTLDRLVRDSTRNRINVGSSGGEIYSPARVYQQLRNWPEFRVRFGDRVQKHLFNGGALTPTNNVTRLLGPAAIIRNALTGESARWGDARKTGVPAGQVGTGVTFTRDEWWQPEIDKLATNFFQRLTADNVARFISASLYPTVSAPLFSQFGGAISNGFQLTITHTNPSGTIYFTTDGTDPRVYGSGAVAASAQAFTAPFPINTPTLVRARVLNGSTWSALVEAMFFPPQDLGKLALTEIMYNPPAVGLTNGEDFEFIELKNFGTNTLNLSGLNISNAFDFVFTNGTLLAPGDFFVIVRNPAAFAAKYPGVTINGIYSGKLDNGGEKITLSHALGATIFSVSYGDAAPWPAAADGYGFSLVPKNPGVTQAPDDGSKWRASASIGGSPGADDPAPFIAPIVINEILTHTVPPAVDRIELFNPTGTNVDLSGWFLTDDRGVAKKYRITNGTAVAAGGFITFDESQFNPTPGAGLSFSLNSHGDQVYLFSADPAGNLTGYSHGFSFGGAASGVSFGRHVNSVGDEQFPAQLATTFNSANAGPRVGPVVVNEIHYHPAQGGDEFVELKNITSTNVPLFDPTFPTNLWKLDGLNVTFPPMTLPPNGLLLLINTNATYFRAKYSVPTNVFILLYSANLQASGERLELTRPDAPDTNGVSRIAVDGVRYNDKLPWPPAADGSGPSLQRRNSAQYGDDPMNWQAAAPTPGRENSEPDTDGDGIPDSWEIATGTNPLVPDANNDEDGDGFSNLQEYLAGTNPHDAESYLRVDSGLAGNLVQLQFNAVSNRAYQVLFKDTLTNQTWLPLTNISAAPQNRAININDARTNTTRFYRIAVP